ncbi:hypothetical protein [Bacillus cereus]|uniref:hypothetical protein n=1 Tax=Bacillus cereus TaxID=1396 RepID=UPI001A998B5F|nr:hypothetical protein [Bacillus cereus]HDR4850220.1 hypothetical protein [Bacillus cereus]
MVLKILPMFLFTMATNKETVTTTLISIELPIIITMVLVFRFPPIVITMALIFRFPPIITTMIFLRTPAIIIPGHSFIPPFN